MRWCAGCSLAGGVRGVRQGGLGRVWCCWRVDDDFVGLYNDYV